MSSIISLDRLSALGWGNDLKDEQNDELQPLGPDSDYNSANDPDEQEFIEVQENSAGSEYNTIHQSSQFGTSCI